MALIQIFYYSLLAIFVLLVLGGFRIVRPTERLVVETFGKFTRIKEAGLTWLIPIVQRGYRVNITEQMADTESQSVITKDNLNVIVDAVVYYKIQDVKKSIYNVDNHRTQLTSLARTTLRAVLGKMSLADANENRATINSQMEGILTKETVSYGVNVLRVEIERIDPPQDVQQAMNEVVKAERKKLASKDLANAVEIEADGRRRAAIKEAQGMKEAAVLKAQGSKDAQVLEAEGKAKAFDLVNKSFKGNAQILKKYEVTQASLEKNSKIVLTEKGIKPSIIMDAVSVKNV